MNIGLIGTGTVGSGVIRIYQKNREHLRAHSGETIQLKSVCDLDLSRCPHELSEFQQIHDWHVLLSDPEIQVVVELIGGEDPARTIIVEALQSGKHVVTANKLVMAKYGKDLLALAAEKKVFLLFEAAVAGAVPIINALRNPLLPNHIQAVYGIVNGTTNFILTQMHQGEIDFQSALKEAQRLGYAEADPTSDVEGFDSLFKICLLASAAYQAHILPEEVLVEGIAAIAAQDIQWVKKQGQVIKLVALARWTNDKLELRVHPAILESSHPLATVDGVFNAVYLQADCCGDLMFYGRGAGGVPTASSVWADLLAIANQSAYQIPWLTPFDLLPKEKMESRFRFRLRIIDRASLIAETCGVFAAYQVSVHDVVRTGWSDEAELIINTDRTEEKFKNRLLDILVTQPWVKEVASVIRIGL